MITQKARMAFTARFTHPSFSDGLGRWLRFRPLDPAWRVMSMVSAHFLEQISGFSVATFQSLPTAGPGSTLPSGNRLPFAIDVRNPDFYQYTDLTFQPGHIYYFNPRNGTVPRSLPTTEAIFAVSLPDGLDPKTMAVHPLARPPGTEGPGYGRISLTQLNRPTGHPVRRLQIDLSGEQDGAYELIVNAGKANAFHYAFMKSRDLTWNQAFGVCEWDVQAQDPPTVSYEVALPQRQYTWVYQVSSVRGISLDTPQVKSNIGQGRNNIGFKALVFPHTPDDLFLVSSAPLPLMEQADWKIFLTTKGFPRGVRLPLGAPQNLIKDDSKQFTRRGGLVCRIKVRL